MAVQRLINMYRVRGHLIADLDPLRWREPHMHPELDPLTYDLTIWDLDREYLTGGLAGVDRMDLGNILKVLRDAYCRTIGIEYMHIQEPEQKAWIQEQVEGVAVELDTAAQQHVLGRLNAAEAFEKFLATKYVGQKRFGLEGGESAIVILDAVLEAAAAASMDKAILGMAHRGRLNVLVNIVGKHHDKLFSEFEGHIPQDSVQGSGDVKYHLGQEGVFSSRHGDTIPVALAANPSHLEAVDPVVIGMARAIEDQIDQPDAFSVLPVLIHGDAAFAGQGVVAETLQMSDIRGYRVGGTVHVIINNQIGYTTTPEASRSGFYSTDVAKMVQAPVFHVNGDDPEACVRAARLAFEFRQRFNKDVVIDMVCYRRHGHNEGDDPSYTQPLMYAKIDQHRSVRKLYTESLVKRGHLTLEEAEHALDDFQERLQVALDETRSSAPDRGDRRGRAARRPRAFCPTSRPASSGPRSTRSSPRSTPGPTTSPSIPSSSAQFEARRKMWGDEGEVDWGLAENLAYGTLLREGIDIRLAGQDTRRGTFAHRHAVLHDHLNGTEYTPLANLADDQGKFWIYDSLLSEYAALGFEYGYSVENQDALVLWEAQFGDFVNGAQIIIDQFIVAAGDKWKQDSGLVMLLPHGYEGQGPEHSSARMERFLLLCAEDNIQVANCTTSGADVPPAAPPDDARCAQAAGGVHAQVAAPGQVGPVLDRLPGRTDRSRRCSPTPPSSTPAPSTASCSPPARSPRMPSPARDERGAPVAIVRVEQLYPWPLAELAAQVGRYPNASELVWLQEEPENMGAWNFVKGRLYDGFGDSHKIRRVSRFESGSPATGSNKIHGQEQAAILDKALTF